MDMHSGYLLKNETSVGRDGSSFDPPVVLSHTLENQVANERLPKDTPFHQQQPKGGEHLSRHQPLVEEGSLSEDLAQFSTSSSTSGGDAKELTAPNVNQHHLLEVEPFKTSTPTTTTSNPQPSPEMPYNQMYQGLNKVDHYPYNEETPWLSRLEGYPHQTFENEYNLLPPLPHPSHPPPQPPFFRVPAPGIHEESQMTSWPIQFPHPYQPSPRLPPTLFQQQQQQQQQQQPTTTMGGGGFGEWPRTLGLDSPGAYIDRNYILDVGTGRRKNATRESTSTLKAWLQEHIKNPYPTKGEKIMLAIITKMTLTQVSTWFANARRRLKKEKKMTWVPRTRNEEDSETTRGSRDHCEDDLEGNPAKGLSSEKGEAEEESISSTSSVTSSAEEEEDKRDRHDHMDGVTHAFQPPNLRFSQSGTSSWKDELPQATQTPFLPSVAGISTNWSSGISTQHPRIQAFTQMTVPRSHPQWLNENCQNTSNTNDRFPSLSLPWMNQISRYPPVANSVTSYHRFHDENLVTNVNDGFSTHPAFEASQEFNYQPPYLAPPDYPPTYSRQIGDEEEGEAHPAFAQQSPSAPSPIESSLDYQPSSFLNELNTSHFDKMGTG